MKRISIDPITRLEGHGRIDIFFDDAGHVAHCYLVVPELRGFERFLEGRPVEELPRITCRICGVCPEAHSTCSAKAVDAVYGVTPPPAAEIIRRLQYNAFSAGDHATHFFALGGPDFIMGPDAPPAERNLLGVIRKVGSELAGRVIRMRQEAHEVAELLGGRRVHPVGMIPGGQSRPVTEEMRDRLVHIAENMVSFSRYTQELFADLVLGRSEYLELITSDAFRSETHYMALVNEDDLVDVFHGHLRVVDPEGNLVARFHPSEYLDHIAERVEPWTYMKLPYLRQVGWRGLEGGASSGVYRVGPLGMLNASKGMQTPLAQAEYERLYDTLGPRPVHATLAYHWARIIEMLQCSELVARHAADERLTDPHVRVEVNGSPGEGVGCVEAPRGILIHHYQADEAGLIRRANLIVGTNHNHAPLQLSVKQAAQSILRGNPEAAEPLLNQVEMAFRAYDPCLACATHALPGRLDLPVHIHAPDGRLLRRIARRPDGGLSLDPPGMA